MMAGGSPPPKLFWGFTGRQWRVLNMVVGVTFCAGMAYSILAPLYPPEAAKKGIPPSEFGFVFGVYELANFIVGPLFGLHMARLGPKRVFHTGMIVSSSLTFAFSFLDSISDHFGFLMTTFALRVPQAIAASAVLTSSFTIIAVEFPKSLSLAFSIVETTFGFGLCIGPPFGTGLFQVGGFTLPFMVIGGIYFLCSILSIHIFWREDFNKAPDIELGKNGKAGLVSLLSIPSVALPFFAAFIFEICTGVLPVLLEPHLRMFNISPFGIGLVFMLYATLYSMTAPIWGTACDKLSQPMYIALTGSALLFIGFVLFGPAPFLPVQPTLWMTLLGLIFISFGYGANNVSSYTIAMRQARLNGFADSVGTYSLVSGTWTSSVALGSCVGPTLAGILYDAVGLRYQILLNLAMLILLMTALIGFLFMNRKRDSRAAVYGLEENEEETTPILRKRSDETIVH